MMRNFPNLPYVFRHTETIGSENIFMGSLLEYSPLMYAKNCLLGIDMILISIGVYRMCI